MEALAAALIQENSESQARSRRRGAGVPRRRAACLGRASHTKPLLKIQIVFITRN